MPLSRTAIILWSPLLSFKNYFEYQPLVYSVLLWFAWSMANHYGPSLRILDHTVLVKAKSCWICLLLYVILSQINMTRDKHLLMLASHHSLLQGWLRLLDNHLPCLLTHLYSLTFILFYSLFSQSVNVTMILCINWNSSSFYREHENNHSGVWCFNSRTWKKLRHEEDCHEFQVCQGYSMRCCSKKWRRRKRKQKKRREGVRLWPDEP